MKENFKRRIAIMLIAACMVTTAVPVSAASIPFTIRLEHGGLKDSPDSVKKILKNTDGDANFYVTVKSFNNSGDSNGKVRIFSKKIAMENCQVHTCLQPRTQRIRLTKDHTDGI